MMIKISNVCCCNGLILFFHYPAKPQNPISFTIKLIELKINGSPKNS